MQKRKASGELFPPQFIQVLAQPWEGDEGKSQSSLVTLAADGSVYKYYHSEKAWVPLSMDILRRV